MADKTEKKPGFVARAKTAVKNFCARVAKFFRGTCRSMGITVEG